MYVIGDITELGTGLILAGEPDDNIALEDALYNLVRSRNGAGSRAPRHRK
jgi:hypothetical protein